MDTANCTAILLIKASFQAALHAVVKQFTALMSWGINLVIQPGKHYLLLGPPGSGKSTLLKTIAGLIRHDEDDDVGEMSAGNVHPSLQGEILYNGRSLKVRIVLCVNE